MAWEELKSSGITSKTPENIMLGAGTVHRGLAYDSQKKQWNFEESLIGATSGGTKLTIKPEIKNIEVDGALVKVKGFTVKMGEVATVETNLVEMTPELIQMTVIAEKGKSTIDGYDELVSKRQFEDGDYIENFGYIGHKMTGEPIIIIFDYALCSSGFEVEGKNKENGVFPATFECYAEISPEADILPYHIYTPTKTVAATEAANVTPAE